MQYRDELYHENLANLASNWPDLPKPRQRKERRFYAIDRGDETIAKVTTLDYKLAKSIADKLGGVPRLAFCNEETHREAAATRRERCALGDWSVNN